MDENMLNDLDQFVQELHQLILRDDFIGAGKLSAAFIRPRMGPGYSKEWLFRGDPKNLSSAIHFETRSAYCGNFPNLDFAPERLSPDACLALRNLLGQLPGFALGKFHRPIRLLADMRELTEEYLAHRGYQFHDQNVAELSRATNWLHSPSDQPPARFRVGGQGPVLATQAEIGFLLRPHNARKVSDNSLRAHLKKIAGMANSRVWVRETRTRYLEAYFCLNSITADPHRELEKYRKLRSAQVRTSSRNRIREKRSFRRGK